MGKGQGFGKVILVNDHFVVYGIPGIASALERAAFAEAVKTNRPGIDMHDERTGSVGYTEQKRLQQVESIERMLKAMDVNPKTVSLSIKLGGNLPGFSGIGASGASSVAIARAISEELGLNLPDDKINDAAYEAEKAYAGNPSGIDNTVSTYGGLVWYKKDVATEKYKIEPLHLRRPIEIVIGSTGKVANTKIMVEGVKERRNKNTAKYDQIFKQAENLALAARRALETYDLKKLGELMNENHRQLQQIEVSSKELDLMVDEARRQGAFGAKLTGGGGGGCMVALTPGKDLQGKVASAFKTLGFDSFSTKIGMQTY